MYLPCLVRAGARSLVCMVCTVATRCASDEVASRVWLESISHSLQSWWHRASIVWRHSASPVIADEIQIMPNDRCDLSHFVIRHHHVTDRAQIIHIYRQHPPHDQAIPIRVAISLPNAFRASTVREIASLFSCALLNKYFMHSPIVPHTKYLYA